MQSRNKLGIILAVVFTVVSFILCMYDTFSNGGAYLHSTSTWLMGLFSLLSVIFAISLFSAKGSAPLMFAVICIIVSGIFAIVMGMYWLLICLIISLIGCILYRAGRAYHPAP